MPAVIAKFDSRAAKFFVSASFILATIGNQVAAGVYPFSNASTAVSLYVDMILTPHYRILQALRQSMSTFSGQAYSSPSSVSYRPHGTSSRMQLVCFRSSLATPV
jgi:hypothetical protein